MAALSAGSPSSIHFFEASRERPIDANVQTSRLRQRNNFLKQFNPILPVQSCPKKYFALSQPQITSIFRASRLT
jgi:hypothetical protein